MNMMVKQNDMKNNIPTPPVPKMNWCSLVFDKRP